MYFHYLFSSLKEITRKNNSFYPMILVPEELKNIVDEEIPLDFYEPLKPTLPIKTKIDVRGYFIILILLILILLIATAISTDIAGIIFIIGSLLILLHWVSLNNASTNSFLSKISDYNEDMSKYNTLFKEYTEQVNAVRTFENTENYRRKLINELLSKARKPTKSCQNKEGPSESYFENYLNIWFEGKIFKNYTFHLIDDKQAYIPDFIYQNGNLHIDIEIDEPYMLESRKPIHYFKESGSVKIGIDNDRNNLFTNHLKWFVVRFAEEQVVNQPNECCYIIDKLIDLITINPSELNSPKRISFSNEEAAGLSVDKSLLYHLEKEELKAGNHRSMYVKNISLRKAMAFSNLKIVKAWTEDEANTLAKSRSRETYLLTLPEIDQTLNNWNDEIELDKETYLNPIFKPPITNNEPDWLDNDSDDLPF